MKVWILLLIILVVLILATFRERFEATPTIKDPSTWDEAEVKRIKGMVTPISTLNDEEVRSVVGGFWSKWKGATNRIPMSEITNYLREKVSGSDPKFEKFKELLKAYYVDQGQSVFNTASGYTAALTEVGQTSGYSVTPNESQSASAPVTPAGGTAGAAGGTVGAAGTAGAAGGTAGGATSGTPPPPPGSGVAAGNTTGGSSTTTRGPTNTPSTSGFKGIFGPAFAGSGFSTSGAGGDSSRTTTYPQLLGGQSKASSLVEGAGIVNPTNIGELPTADQTGSSENSKYFPNSRVPGDKDLIPDPYRVSQTFSSSSYSSKTEPTPFLTDFSAFLK